MTDDLLTQIHALHDELQREMRERFDRDLPFDELVFDRWERASRLGFGDGALIVADVSQGRSASAEAGHTHSVMVRVDDVDDHFQRVSAAGAHVVSGPETHAYGERQYAAIDLAGHRWTFTQSVADVSPETWGGTTATPW